MRRHPAPGVKTCREPMGASMTGMRRLWPRKVVEGLISETSTSTRGAEGYAVEGEPVAPHGGLGLGAAYEVVPRALDEVLAGFLHYLFVADKVGGHVCSPPEWLDTKITGRHARLKTRPRPSNPPLR